MGVSYYEQMHFIVKKENIDIALSSVDELLTMNEKVGIKIKVHYPIISSMIRKNPSIKSNFVEVATYELNAAMTQKGRILGFFENKPSVLWKIRNQREFINYQGLVVHSFALTEPFSLYVGASFKMNKSVRNKLRETLKKLNDSGYIQKTIDSWLH